MLVPVFALASIATACPWSDDAVLQSAVEKHQGIGPGQDIAIRVPAPAFDRSAPEVGGRKRAGRVMLVYDEQPAIAIFTATAPKETIVSGLCNWWPAYRSGQIPDASPPRGATNGRGRPRQVSLRLCSLSSKGRARLGAEAANPRTRGRTWATDARRAAERTILQSPMHSCAQLFVGSKSTRRPLTQVSGTFERVDSAWRGSEVRLRVLREAW